MSLTRFPHGILATPNLGGSMMTQGNIFFVKPSSGNDGNAGDTPNTAFKTLAKALSAATANQNDIVYMFQESNTASKTTDYQDVPLDWNKDSVHLVGVGAASGLFLGQRCRIANLSTAASASTLMTVSANNCIISGIELFHQAGGDDLSAAQIALTVSGQRNLFSNCQISGVGDATLDTSGSASLSIAGAENMFKDCYIGLDTVLRAEAIAEVYLSTNATRTVFENCIINSYTSGTTFKAMNFAAGSYHTATWLNRCMITNALNRTSVVTTTGAISAPTSGTVYINGGGVFGYTNVTTANSVNVYVSAPILGTGIKQGVAGPVLIS
jgi:hypothetical protein